MNAFSAKPARSRTWTGFLQHDWDSRLMTVRPDIGTWVLRKNGARLGRIDHFLLGKVGGRIEYAVIDGSGSDMLKTALYPVPWEMLRMDEGHAGFMLEGPEDLLINGPSYPCGEDPDLSYMRCVRLHNHYGLFF